MVENKTSEKWLKRKSMINVNLLKHPKSVYRKEVVPGTQAGKF
jgi:hypothetical protein